MATRTYLKCQFQQLNAGLLEFDDKQSEQKVLSEVDLFFIFLSIHLVVLFQLLLVRSWFSTRFSLTIKVVNI